MKRHCPTLKLAWLICLSVGSILRADLLSDVRRILQDRSVKSDKVGVEIIQLGDGTPETIFEHNATIPLIPASNLKLVTTAAALELLGRDFRFRTTLVLRGDDIAIIGDGDPSLGDAEMLRKVGWGIDTVFQNWAGVLEKRGITRLNSVSVDDSVFDEIFVHPNWPIEQQHKRYVAQVGGVNLNANCVDFFLRTGAYGDHVTYTTDPATRYISVANACTFGDKNAVWLARQLGGNSIILRGETNAGNIDPISVTVHDPALFAATVLAESLGAAGIPVDAQIKRDPTIRQQMLGRSGEPSQRWIPIAIHETPISTVLARANKDSMNLYAEALCKRIGFASSGLAGSWQNGTAAIAAFLQSLGVAPTEFTIDDGSGLSKKNAISANAMARVLAHVFKGENRQVFIDSLSVAGSDGTLERRFRDSDLRGRVFAKSGYVAGVSSLSGYVKTKDERWFAFAILMNSVTDVASAKAIQERIVTAIDRNAR